MDLKKLAEEISRMYDLGVDEIEGIWVWEEKKKRWTKNIGRILKNEYGLSPEDVEKVEDTIGKISKRTEVPENIIAFKNGLLDVYTKGFYDPSPDMFYRNTINAYYNPEAECPQFMEWLKEILPEEEKRMLVQEMFGYCFFRAYPIKKTFFLVGKPSTGKKTLIKTLESILGYENSIYFFYHELFDPQEIPWLAGKLLCIINEPEISSREKNDKKIKALLGEEPLIGEKKGKKVKFYNYAKLIFLSNDPNAYETIPFKEHAVVINFEVKIPEEKIIKDIEGNWLGNEEERSGIVNWALEGLLRVLSEKKFTGEDYGEENRHK